MKSAVEKRRLNHSSIPSLVAGNVFSRKSTLEHHQQHFYLSQQGSDVKRTLDQETGEVKRVRPDLPKKIDEKGIPNPSSVKRTLEQEIR